MTTVTPQDDLARVLNSQSDSKTPRFQKIAAQLRANIVSGRWPEHASLPSERGIAEECGVSRMTARRALEALELNGLIYSEDRRGRFVSPKRITYDVSNMVSFVKDAVAKEIDLQIKLMRSCTRQADAKLAQKLAIETGDRIHEYTRLFRSRGHAIFIETEYLIAKPFPGFLDHDLEQSTTHLLESHYSTRAHTGDITIRMRGVHEHESEALGLAANQAAIELEQIISDGRGTPFCFGRQLWRGELAEFSARALVNGEVPA